MKYTNCWTLLPTFVNLVYSEFLCIFSFEYYNELFFQVPASIYSTPTPVVADPTATFDLNAAASTIGNPSWASNILDSIDDESPIPLDASEGGFFTGTFLPPPPRPLFLDDCATPDGVTTCDLCTWAWQQDSSGLHGYDPTKGKNSKVIIVFLI